MEELKLAVRELLLNSGFSEAEKQFLEVSGKPFLKISRNFYKQDTDLTAFFANVNDRGDRFGICLGIASTAFTRMKGDEDSLKRYGILNEVACLRYFVWIRQPEDIFELKRQICQLEEAYSGVEKDRLLEIIKEKRKAFIRDIHDILKPYGFKKKGNSWSLLLPENYILRFDAEKCFYCDYYQFDFAIISQNTLHQESCRCFNSFLRLDEKKAFDPYATYRFDWQMNSREELRELLGTFLQGYVEPIRKDGLATFGMRDYIRRTLTCDGKQCNNCWTMSEN